MFEFNGPAKFCSYWMGRFLSPDYNESGDEPDPVPYANLGNPQSLNLYAYARNNPLRNIDPDGHSCTTTSSTDPDGTIHVTVTCHDDPQPLMLAGAVALSNEEFGPAAWIVGGGLLAAGCIQAHCGSMIANLFSGQNSKPVPPVVAPANTANPNPGNQNGKNKLSNKIRKQMAKRGWTEQSIDQTTSQPVHTSVSTNMATGNPATAYFNADGSYVVVDNVTNEVTQISDRTDPNWVPDSRIVDPYQP